MEVVFALNTSINDFDTLALINTRVKQLGGVTNDDPGREKFPEEVVRVTRSQDCSCVTGKLARQNQIRQKALTDGGPAAACT